VVLVVATPLVAVANVVLFLLLVEAWAAAATVLELAVVRVVVAQTTAALVVVVVVQEMLADIHQQKEPTAVLVRLMTTHSDRVETVEANRLFLPSLAHR
jgi:hypothetical protein